MTIQQTIDVPAGRRPAIEVPREIPEGTAILTFKTASAGDTGDEAAAILAEEARIRELNAKYPIHVYTALAEAEAAAEGQNTAEGREAFREMLKRTHGVLKNSKAWGRGVDVDAKIRALRDEWGNGNE